MVIRTVNVSTISFATTRGPKVAPFKNEDRFALAPRACAVIDGADSVIPLTFYGVSTAEYAAEILRRSILAESLAV